MQTYGLTLQLVDDAALIERYKEHHRRVWPEVTARLREVGITEMRIYLLGRRLFMYVEAGDGFDPARDFARINEDPRSWEWDVLMRTMQERVTEAAEGEWWATMEPVFDLSVEPASGGRAVGD
jgi:L-rhamnose mutarotase